MLFSKNDVIINNNVHADNRRKHYYYPHFTDALTLIGSQWWDLTPGHLVPLFIFVLYYIWYYPEAFSRHI